MLRVTMQKLSAESGLACDSVCLHVCWEHVPAQSLLCTSLSPHAWQPDLGDVLKGPLKALLLNFCHQRDGRAGMFSQSVMELAPFPCSAKSSLPKMTFSRS